MCITTEEIHLLKEQQLESATLALKEEKHSIDVSYFMNAAQKRKAQTMTRWQRINVFNPT